MIIWGQKEGRRKEGQTDREMVNYSMIIKIIIQLYFRPQPIDTHIQIQIQYGRINTVEYVHISVIDTV